MNLKKILLTAGSILLFSQYIFSDNLENYFYDMAVQSSSPQKIYFLQKSIEVNPLFKPAYDALAEEYALSGDAKNSEEIKQVYAKELEKQKKSEELQIKTSDASVSESNQSAEIQLPGVHSDVSHKEPAAETKPRCGALKNESCNQKKNPSVCPEKTDCEKEKYCPEEIFEDENFVIKQSCEKKNFTKPVIYGAAGLALAGAAGYYGFEKYIDYKKNQIKKKVLIYSAGAAAVGVSAYCLYKYFLKTDPVIPESSAFDESLDSKIKEYLNRKKSENSKNSENANQKDILPPPPMYKNLFLPENNNNSGPTTGNRNSADNSASNQIQENFFFPVYNLKTVTLDELSRIPGCDDFTAQLIDRYKSYLVTEKKQDGFNSIDELYSIPLIDKEKIDIIKKYFYVK
ncbi:MAG TPA: hypothetical protein PKY81_14660 [bacterium]|nr:hypothetical protein [bacterium]HPN32190.1 hypothetical protein [bacterium]